MIIAFTGAQSVGKTTLLEALKKNLLLTNRFTFKESFVRKLKKEHSKEEANKDEVQKEVVATHLSNLNYKDVVLDRCLLDSIVYALYYATTGDVSRQVFLDALKTLIENRDKYDILFYIRPEFGVVSDGERSSSPEFQKEIASIFDTLIPMMPNVVELKGTVDNRLHTIYQTFKERGVLC